MSTLPLAESPETIAARMDVQRAALHRQFAPAPRAVEPVATAGPADAALQPYQPKSLLMQLLVANPQLIQRLLVLAASTALGARYSSWAMRLFGLFMTVRRRH